MRARLKSNLLTALVLAFVPATHAAQHIDFDRVIACSTEADDARRLACYDNAVASTNAAVNEAPAASHVAPAATAQPAALPSVAPATAVAMADDFGVEGSAVARQRRSEQEQAEEKSDVRSIIARVAELTSRPRGELMITLDNGQVWVQKSAETYFPVKVGDQVTINAGLLGSFRMINGKRNTQVTRVK